MKKHIEVNRATISTPNTPGQHFEIARSGLMNLRSLRQIVISLYGATKTLMAESCEQNKVLATAQDIAAEYNYTLKLVDDFYVQAKKGLCEPKIYLVAESNGIVKKMEVFVKEKE